MPAIGIFEVLSKEIKDQLTQFFSNFIGQCISENRFFNKKGSSRGPLNAIGLLGSIPSTANLMASITHKIAVFITPMLSPMEAGSTIIIRVKTKHCVRFYSGSIVFELSC